MPFRGVVEDFKFGELVKLVTAEDGDVEVTISAKPYGATGTSGTPNFWVGGPDMGKDGPGLLVSSNEWTTTVTPGDELWVRHAEDLPFASSWTITALIRSERPSLLDTRNAFYVSFFHKLEGVMAYTSGSVVIGTAAGVICNVPIDGEVMLQNVGTAAVTLGGPGVVAGQGPTLPAGMTSPDTIPTGVVHGQADNDDRLYGRVAGGSTTVEYMVAG